MLRKILLGGLVISAFCFTVPASAATVFYDVTGVNATGNVYGGNSGTVTDLIAQKYTAPAAQTLCTLYLSVARLSSAITAPSLVLHVRQGGSNPESGTEVASSSVAAVSLPLNLANFTNYTAFALPQCISLTSGTTYWFTFENKSPTFTISFGNYVSGYRSTDQFSYSSLWLKTCSSCTPGFVWQENTGREWGIKLEGPDPAPPAKEPVIIVPGILGSFLNRASDGGEVWPNILNMLKPGSDSYLDELKLDGTGNVMNVGAIIDRAGVFTVYKNLLDQFINSGYASGTNLFTAPYDWRLDIATSMSRLGTVVKTALAHSPTGKVNIIAHSLGGVLVKEYLRQATSTAFVDKLVLAGVPELGSPKTFKALTYGDDFGMRKLGFGVNPDRMKIISQDMPAVYQLLPSQTYLSQVGRYIVDFTGTSGVQLDYAQSRAFMLRDSNDSRNPALLNQADIFHQTLDPIGFNIPVSSIYRLSACQNPETIGDIRINSKTDREIDPIDGDGTVPLRSATYSPAGTSYYALYSETGIDHMGLASDSRTIQLMRDIIVSTSTPVLPAGISTAKSDCGIIPPNSLNQVTIAFSTHSPVTLHVYDVQNRHVGPDGSGDIELGIPGSDYEMIGDNSFAFVPGGQTYRVVANGTATGSFNLKAKIFNGVALQSVTTYLSVPLQGASTTAQMQFSSSNTAGVLQVDAQGDGVIDSNVQPNAVLSGVEAADITPPIIDVQSPDDFEFRRNEVVSMLASAADSESGVASLVTRLDGVALATSSIDLFYQPLGDHTLNFLAYDKAGNPRETEQQFTSYADATSTIGNIERAFTLGWIKKKDIKNDLIKDMKAIVKLEKKILKLQAKLPPAVMKKLTPTQRIQKQIEIIETKIDKIQGKNFVNELEKKYKNGTITINGYNLLKENIEWMMNN